MSFQKKVRMNGVLLLVHPLLLFPLPSILVFAAKAPPPPPRGRTAGALDGSQDDGKAEILGGNNVGMDEVEKFCEETLVCLEELDSGSLLKDGGRS
jgi:hypothetical protein